MTGSLRQAFQAGAVRELARTIRRYRASILDRRHHRVAAHQRDRQSNNAAIGRIRANACCFHDLQAFITMIMLDRAGLASALPWTTK